MNTTDAEIAGKLDEMQCGSVTLRRGMTLDDVWLTLTQRNSVEDYEDSITFSVDGFLAFCRAVVERVQEKCRWKQDDTGDWFTHCGEGWTFTDGGVAENRIKFCPYCGKPIEAVEYKEPMEET